MANQIQPSVGRIVHFISGAGTLEPAVVTRVWTRECVNLQVLPDCGAPYVQTSVVYNEEHSPYSWKWPERV